MTHPGPRQTPWYTVVFQSVEKVGRTETKLLLPPPLPLPPPQPIWRGLDSASVSCQAAHFPSRPKSISLVDRQQQNQSSSARVTCKSTITRCNLKEENSGLAGLADETSVSRTSSLEYGSCPSEASSPLSSKGVKKQSC